MVEMIAPKRIRATVHKKRLCHQQGALQRFTVNVSIKAKLSDPKYNQSDTANPKGLKKFRDKKRVAKRKRNVLGIGFSILIIFNQ
jgi:hypothetical protein